MPRLNQTVPTDLDIHFPKCGMDLSQPAWRQPTRQLPGGEYARTTVFGENVRTYPGSEGRSRGGSRGGLSRWIAERPWGGGRWVVQELAVVVTAGATAPGGGVVQTSSSGRVVTVVAVQRGNLFPAVPGATAWAAASNVTAANPAMNFFGVVASAPLVGKLWLVDGVNYRVYDPSDNSVRAWQSSVPGIDLPQGPAGNKPKLIAAWGHRILLAGIRDLPLAVFASKIDDPTNHDTDPPEGDLATRAWALTTGSGNVGDMVTALMPYTDDLCFVGTDHELHLISGDPAANGQLDAVSRSVGVAWGSPWCVEPSGGLWFFSNRMGLYRVVPGSKPEHMSWPVNALLDRIDSGAHTIRLAWDDRHKAVLCFVTPTAQAGAARHWAYETITGSWWPFRFKNPGHNPLCLCTLDGNRPDDRRILLGCWDGYVRMLDPDATTDDGEKIEWEVFIGPLVSPNMDEIRLDYLQPVLSEASGEVTIKVYVGDTAEQALEDEGQEVGVAEAGLNPNYPVRLAGKAVYVGLSGTDRFALESIRATFAPTGKVRQRRFS